MSTAQDVKQGNTNAGETGIFIYNSNHLTQTTMRKKITL